jgi:hypothetical protein
MKLELQSLSSVGTVNVTRSVTYWHGGATWTVIFTSLGYPDNVGDLPDFVTNTRHMSGTGARSIVTQLIAGTDPVGGTFKLAFVPLYSQLTPLASPVPVADRNVSITNGATYLNTSTNLALAAGGLINRGDTVAVWTDEFPELFYIDSLGALADYSLPLDAPYTGVTTAATTLYVYMPGQVTVPLSSSVSAEDMKLALEDLDTIGTVDVTRTGPVANSRGYSWTVTFLTEGGDMDFVRANGICCDVQLTGSNVAIAVTSHASGSAPLTGAFKLQFDNQWTSAIAYDAPASVATA